MEALNGTSQPEGLAQRMSLLKKAFRRSINMAGFEIMRTSSAGELRDLEHYWMMRAFHSRDAREIEGLYPTFSFP